MIPQDKIDQVKLLLATGLSQREIGRHVGVSRASVNNIANNKHTKNEERRKQHSESLIYPTLHGRRKYGKCPNCGVTVQVPCFKCQIDNWKTFQK